jgi:hypothetical protein
MEEVIRKDEENKKMQSEIAEKKRQQIKIA